jgi:hypothetical protein
MAVFINSGKPMIEHSANQASRGQSARRGGVGRAHSSVSAARTAATKARPAITNVGLKSATAIRVAGSVKPKITTPISASSRAWR